MKNSATLYQVIICICISMPLTSLGQKDLSPIAHYTFNKTTKNQIQDTFNLKGNKSPEYIFDSTIHKTVLHFSGTEFFNTHIPLGISKQPHITIIARIHPQSKGFLLNSQSTSQLMPTQNMLIQNNILSVQNLANKKGSPIVTLPSQSNTYKYVSIAFNQTDSLIQLCNNNTCTQVSWQNFPDKDAVLYIGKGHSQSTNFNGYIDEIIIYNTILSPEKINEIIAQKSSSEESTIPYKKIGIGLMILYACIVLFMIYKLVFKRTWFKPIHTKTPETENETETENEEIGVMNNKKTWDTLYTIWGEWHYSYVNEYDEEIRIPPNYSSIKKALQTFKHIQEAELYDNQIVDFINKLGSIINTEVKRKFHGSWLIIIASFILPIGYILVNYNHIEEIVPTILLLFIPGFVYFISCLTPKFVIRKRSQKQESKGFVYKIQHFFYTSIQSAKNEIISNSKTKIHAFLKIIIIIISIALTLVLSLIIALLAAGINFFRNFVFYK
ncbi:MAG: LamG-like jellyroll fold domain-containing protein [Bacteroidales bacterium]